MLASCDDTQQEPTIQWYPVITLEGDVTCYVEIGSDWTLPGYSAINTMNNTDATSDVEVLIYDVLHRSYVSSINTDDIGMYTVYYNSYGSMVATEPTVTKTRSIYVYDPTVTTNIEGTWMVNIDESYRIRYAGANAGQKMTFNEVATANENSVSDGIPVVFSQLVPGFYYVDDIEAGLVTMLYGYAANYPQYNFQMHAYLSLSADNELTLLTSTFGYSGFASTYALTDFEGQYDPETETIHYIADLGNQGFYLDVVLQPEEE